MKKKPVLLRAINEINNSNNNQPKISKVIEGFRKLLIGVYDQPEFSSEFAWQIAKVTDFSVLLIDADALEPLIDKCLGIKNTVNSNLTSQLLTKSSFNMAMDYVAKERFNKELFRNICVALKDNLYVLTGNDDLAQYEYYVENSYKKLLDYAVETFDIVVVNTNHNLYDAFLVDTFYHSDIMLLPIQANLHNFKIINMYLSYLEDKQCISKDKSKFIVFNYDKNIHLPMSVIQEITNNQCIGLIDSDQRREKSKNDIHTCYAKYMPKHILNQYNKLLSAFNIIPKKSFFERAFGLAKRGG